MDVMTSNNNAQLKLSSTRGPKGATGAKIVSTTLIGQDQSGGNIYRQTFDDGTTATFTAPKGAKGDTGNSGSKGNTGDAGFSPVVSGSKVGKVTTIQITDKTGPHLYIINDGEDGANGIDGTNGTDGEDGFSPTVSGSKVGKVTTLVITDKNGSHTYTVNDGTDGTNGTNGTNGTDGEDGFSPTVSGSKVGKVTTLVITDKNGSHTYTVNDGTDGTNGTNGTDGTDGEDGFSPTVSGSKVGKVTTLVITDKNGPHTYTINDGADGSGSGDMLKATYDPANGARQVAFSDEIPTSAEKAAWDAKYDKPSGGIPDSDIASAGTWNAKGTYSKPSGGIPKTDLASGVQTSLDLADSALQSHQSLAAYRTSSAQDTIDAGKQSKITASGLLKGDGAGGVSGAVAGTDYVATNDSRLSDARTPTAHSHAQSDITGLASALAGKMNVVSVSASDNGKFMRVVNGSWAAVTVPDANGVSF